MERIFLALYCGDLFECDACHSCCVVCTRTILIIVHMLHIAEFCIGDSQDFGGDSKTEEGLNCCGGREYVVVLVVVVLLVVWL
jgi:hypothetical protein